MIKATSAVFCDYIHELRDGRHLLGPILPGLVNFDPAHGGNLTTCLFLCLSCDAPGEREIDIRTTGPGGEVAHLDRIRFAVADTRALVQVALRNISVDATRGGELTVSIREPGDDWETAALLRIDVPRPGPAAPTVRFGYGTGIP